MKLLAVLLLSNVLAFAENPKQKSSLLDVSLYTGVIVTRTMDYITTEQMLANGNRELFLPTALVRNKPAFAVYSIGFGVAECFLADYMTRHNHKVTARIMLLSDSILTGAVAIHNTTLPKVTK